MSITLQALQADGTWAVRNAFITENAKVVSGAMSAADLDMLARRAMSRWHQTYPDGKQLRIHNSDNDPKPAGRKPSERASNTYQRSSAKPTIYGSLKVTSAELELAWNLSEGNDALADAAFQLVRYCRGEISNHADAAEALAMIRGKELAA